MQVSETKLSGVKVISTDVYRDQRGFFTELYRASRYQEILDVEFVQDNFSRSEGQVLRGLHYQLPGAQGKLVQCLRGKILDVAVDIREGSPHFKEWVGITLSGSEGKQVYVPEGFAHGFYVLSDEALVYYKCTEKYRPEDDRGIHWNDSDIGVEWPDESPVLSEKDKNLPSLSEANLPAYEGLNQT